MYLKMVGLLQYMAQIGCFVPAQEGSMLLPVHNSELAIDLTVSSQLKSAWLARYLLGSKGNLSESCAPSDDILTWNLKHGDSYSLSELVHY